jgi:hypothetical protein
MNEQRPALKSVRRIRLAGLSAWLVLCLVLATGRQVRGQGLPPGSHGPFQQPIGQHVGGGLDDIGDGDQVEAARRLRALNEMRQKSLISDTDKLLKLANELNAEVSNENFESLTPEQLHKLATIEKLARSVKEKMSTPVGGLRTYQPFPPAMR